jgi:Transglutaminase-like superfamily
LRSLFLVTRSALGLSRRERLDAARAWLWLVAARSGLTLFSYGRIAQLVARIPARRRIQAGTSPERCARAISRASRLVPGRGCLPQAVATQCLLRREGLTSHIVFGVAQSKDGGLEAHAWLWNDGRILVGGEIADRYAPLAAPRAS